MPSVTFERFDVVVVPFPFTDKSAVKKRPAVILSNADFNQSSGHAVMAMITSATGHDWPLDVAISELDRAGLNVPCAVRCKLFTLDQRLIIRKAGELGSKDKRALAAALKSLLIA